MDGILQTGVFVYVVSFGSYTSLKQLIGISHGSLHGPVSLCFWLRIKQYIMVASRCSRSYSPLSRQEERWRSSHGGQETKKTRARKESGQDVSLKDVLLQDLWPPSSLCIHSSHALNTKG